MSDLFAPPTRQSAPPALEPFAPPRAPSPPPPLPPLPARGPSATTVGVVTAVVGLALGVGAGVWLGRTVPGPTDATPAVETTGQALDDTLDESTDETPDPATEEGTSGADHVRAPRATSEPGVVVDRADPADYPDGGGPTDPWPFDAAYTGDRWDIEVGTPWHGTAPVLAHDPANVGPPDGSQYWIVPVAATYTGHLPSADPSDQVDVVFVDPSGVVHSDGCGAVPAALANAPDVAPGETAEGRLCVTVPLGADGIWRVTVGGSMPIYLSTES
ncbi:hypothetical protein [Cellulosimicrobium sp. CUA-896]|uniref:hypothetical protein n=1 Tax=Cellulosimicrobium sp. CUA-896 TaxID=1517881 RepID=UPI00095D2A43|nr:hypothetical protein [Cellulosimicrobium sp. CUA-896]OLT49532.1 hypothetical protein BJF88_15920 [Cellulosimicrobium sp. CUA-896]